MDSEIKYKTPPSFSQEVSGNKVEVSIEIKGLQKKNKTEAKNAVITLEFDDYSMCITVDGTKGKLENKHFRLKIKKLPGEIDGNKCTWKLPEDNLLEVNLVKAEKESWNLKNGLETFKEEPEKE